MDACHFHESRTIRPYVVSGASCKEGKHKIAEDDIPRTSYQYRGLGMKVHRFVPSHRTGCVEMIVNSSMNSRGNGRLILNRFVLDKYL